MPLRILGGLLIAAAGFGTGCLLSSRLYKRRALLRGLLSFLNRLSTDLRYRGEDIFSLVSGCAAQAGLEPLCVESSEAGFESAWNAAVGSMNLGSEDAALLLELGSQLGKTDLDGQLRHIALLEERVCGRLEETEESISQKARLYKTMGFFVGASAAIVLM